MIPHGENLNLIPVPIQLLSSRSSVINWFSCTWNLLQEPWLLLSLSLILVLNFPLNINTPSRQLLRRLSQLILENKLFIFINQKHFYWADLSFRWRGVRGWLTGFYSLDFGLFFNAVLVIGVYCLSVLLLAKSVIDRVVWVFWARNILIIVYLKSFEVTLNSFSMLLLSILECFVVFLKFSLLVSLVKF